MNMNLQNIADLSNDELVNVTGGLKAADVGYAIGFAAGFAVGGIMILGIMLLD